MPHKGPHLVRFQRLPAFHPRFFRPRPRQRWTQHRGFFNAPSDYDTRQARYAANAALRGALDQQVIGLLVAHGSRHGSRHEARLVATGIALVAGMALAVALTPNLVAATFGAEIPGEYLA